MFYSFSVLSNNTNISFARTMDGHPVPVLVQSEETGNFELDEEALEEVLLNPRIADKYVCVLAVAGAFRKGKSFLLDFLLRYMSSQVSGGVCFVLRLVVSVQHACVDDYCSGICSS